MSHLLKHVLIPVLVGISLFLASLVYYGYAAVNFPTLFNLDNHLNHAATRYIVEHQQIPVVSTEDTEIVFTEFGTTRSLRPPFTFILSAFVAMAADGWVDSRITRQRLGASLIGAAVVVVAFAGFYISFNSIGLALFGAVAIGLLPKFVFLASSNNDDIGAILSVSLLFFSTLALIKYKGETWVLVFLAMSFGLVLQTKFTAWLTLPWLGVFSLMLLRPFWSKVVRLLPLLLVVTLLSGGWWVFFNLIHYGFDDPLAFQYVAELQSTFSVIEPNLQGYASTGVGMIELLTNHDQFLVKSFKSFIGYLEWLELEMGAGTYIYFGSLFFIGLVGPIFRTRSQLQEIYYFEIVILLMILGQTLFYLHHNLIRDIQPQARYVLPIIMPLVYLFLRTLALVPPTTVILKIKHLEFRFQQVASIALLTACVSLHLVTLFIYTKPSFAAQNYYTRITPPKSFNLQNSFRITSTSDISHKYINGKLVLERTGNEVPTLVFDSNFCKLLPLNALITLEINAQSKGGLTLRLDHNNQGSYDNIVWRSFPAGKSLVIFSINTNNCTGAKITLAKQTNHITLDNLQISELKMHQHGKPI